MQRVEVVACGRDARHLLLELLELVALRSELVVLVAHEVLHLVHAALPLLKVELALVELELLGLEVDLLHHLGRLLLDVGEVGHVGIEVDLVAGDRLVAERRVVLTRRGTCFCLRWRWRCGLGSGGL